MMANKRPFFMVSQEARRNAAAFCHEAPDGWMVMFSEPTKRRAQEEKYHAMISDIARQVEHIGRKWDDESMKRLLVDEFADEMQQAGTPLRGTGQVVPSLDGRRIVQLGIQTRGFSVAEASQFIEFLLAWGAQRNVQWSR